MAGLFGLSVNKEVLGDFPEDLFLGTFYQQHLGEDWGGFSIFTEDEVIVQGSKEGLFRPNFEKTIKSIIGTEGIGYCGSAPEPHFADTRLNSFSVCFSGNIINREQLKVDLMNRGQVFGGRDDDVEIIVHLLARGKDIADGFKKMSLQVEGSYNILLLSEKGVWVVRSPQGHWPLVLGKKQGVAAVASESGGFYNQRINLVRDIEPGEIGLLKGGVYEQIGEIESSTIQECSFYPVYTSFAAAVVGAVPSSAVRKKLGAALARRDIEMGFIPDVVIPVPDSGRFHAIGYHQEFCRQRDAGNIKRTPLYDEVLIKYPYAGRSYTPQDGGRRKREAHIKLLPSGERYSGKKVVVCDDSIVRGTQTQNNLVPKLVYLGFSEIHFRISNPELRSHCPYSKTTKRGELFAVRIELEQKRIAFLGNEKDPEKNVVKSLRYNNINDLVEAVGGSLDMLCCVCDRNE